ncbi:hypothetical protein [Streptomyces sp. NPDC058861]|uniref:hypothetical protein n=1 Tax=Streptomyces sp. NPDC058861 TaxID=3346653 RepID=UPI00368D3725
MPEPRQYTAGETARMAAQVARAVVLQARGKSLGPVDRGMTRIQAEACAREAIEDAAREDAEVQRIADRAARAAARRMR